MKKHIIITTIFFLISFRVFSQLNTQETPFFVEFNYEKDKSSIFEMPAIDIEKLLSEDREDDLYGIPPRFGFLHKVNIDMIEKGTWYTMENGDRICQLKLVCSGALSINLLYDKFWLPEGAKLFLYSSDRRHHIGAFTEINNKGTKDNVLGFATGFVNRDTTILEYYLPKSCEEKGIISISGVVHGYRTIIPQAGRECYLFIPY